MISHGLPAAAFVRCAVLAAGTAAWAISAAVATVFAALAHLDAAQPLAAADRPFDDRRGVDLEADRVAVPALDDPADRAVGHELELAPAR